MRRHLFTGRLIIIDGTPLIGVLILIAGKAQTSGLCSKCLEERCYKNGECIIGCVPGFVGEYCNEECPSRCLNRACHLNRIDGTVTCTDGCKQGYCGSQCEVPCPGDCVSCDRTCDTCNVTLCPERRYGADCKEICSPKYGKCDRERGRCIYCRRGYYGDECNQKCTVCFTRAKTIIDSCLSGCDICQSKETCPPGFHGDSCEVKCSPGCFYPGGCNRATGECSHACKPGYYGLNCKSTCSKHCLAGRCNRATGECSHACKPGYHGLYCNSSCNKHCLAGRCNRATGECSEGCLSGYQGLTCNYSCSEFCVGGTCNQLNGFCTFGCINGFKSILDKCERNHYEGTYSVLVIAIGITLFCLVAVMATVAVRRTIRLGRSSNVLRKYVEDECNLQEGLIPADLDEMAKKQILDLRTTNSSLCPKKLSKSERTDNEINSMTSGMIHVSAVETVVSMLQSGKNWVTITGNAGDGKTTLGYLVLRKLREKMRVYSILEPEDYWILLRINEDCVLMLDDRFGSFTSDQVLINKWKTVMRDIHNHFTLNENRIKVIFISRKNVVIETRNYLSHVQDSIFDPENVVDLSSVKNKDERLEILDYYLKEGKIIVSLKVKQRIADLDIAYGYPQCCMMYPKLKTKKHDFEIEEFFNTPLKFLDITTAVLYEENCKDLFKLMIQNNGEFDVYSVENDAQRASLLKVEREQEGSYLTVRENGVCVFAHPSIYDSVLNVICDTDPLFGVKYATSSVIRQKLTLTSDGKMKSPTKINVKPVRPVLKVLAERFRSDILQGDYSIFSHRFCETKHFCEELVTSCTYSHVASYVKAERKQHIDAPGKDGRTMLWTALSAGKKTAVQALVNHGADVNITDGSGITPLLYMCKQGEVDFESIRMVISRKADCNVKDEKERTPLRYLCSGMKVDIETIMIMVTEGGADIKQTDEYGATPLHWLCRNDDVAVDDIKHFTTEIQCDINKQDDFGFTPLHYLCKKTVDIEKLVTLIVDVKGDVKQADQHGNTPLHYLCMNNNVNLDFLLKKIPEADLSMKNMLGLTAKEYLQDKDKTLQKFVDTPSEMISGIKTERGTELYHYPGARHDS